MTPQRLVLVSRRFWPLVGGAEIMMARLAAGFQARGCHTTLLTARWQPEWPAEIEHHGVHVVRLPQPSGRFWGTWRYMSEVTRWLSDRRREIDLVYVSMLKHDAHAALRARDRRSFPVVLRAEGAGITGDCHWQLSANFGRQIKARCLTADALVAASPAIEREMFAAGYPRGRVHYLPNGIAIPDPRGPADREAARQSLAESNPALGLPHEAPLAVYTGRLHAMKGLDHLIGAWTQVISRHPHARLWIVGEGPEHAALAQLIRDLGLSGWVVLAGAFDDVEELLQAADLFVLPSLEEGMSLSVLEAMASELPVIASDIPANRVLIEDGVHGRLAAPRSAEALARCILELLDDPAQAAALAQQARARAEADYSLHKMIDDHLDLFSALRARRLD